MSVRREVIRSVELNLLPLTRVKNDELSSLFSEYLHVANEILFTLKTKRPNSGNLLHHLTYARIRMKSKLPAQLICAARQDVWAKRRHKMYMFRRLPISCNAPRSGSLTQTKRGNPILSVATLDGRLGLPVVKNGAWLRLSDLLTEGWAFTEFRLLSTQMARVTLRREFEVAETASGQAVVGVDVGVGTLAAITVFKASGIMRQLYFGPDVWQVKRDLAIRRSKLQAHASTGSRRARRVLRSLRGYERNFDKTRCYQEAHRIVDLAKQFGATVAIENLKGLNRAKLSRRSNRKVKRMPYFMFSQTLQSVAWQNGVEVSPVNPRYTSQTCPRCRQRGVRKGTLFKCGCGFTANADRSASVNIAKLLWERTQQHAQAPTCFVQFSQSGAAVNQPVRCHDGEQTLVRNHASHHEHRPPTSMGGS
jgi:IS605 OrfB family transposase